MGDDAEGCTIVRSLELFPGQAVTEMVPGGMEDFGALRFRQSTRKMDLDGIYYRRVFRGGQDDEVLCVEEAKAHGWRVAIVKSGGRQSDAK